MVTGVAEQELEAPSDTQLAVEPQMVAELVLQALAIEAVVVATAAAVARQVLEDAPREAQVAWGPQTIPALVWHALD